MDKVVRLSIKAPASAKAAVVAVTGAHSFLGRNLIALLEEDGAISKVVAIDEARTARFGQSTRFYSLDLAEASAEEQLSEILVAEGVTTVVHLGFLAVPTHAHGWAHEYENVGTMRVCAAARKAGTSKFVHWSQTLLYGAHRTNPNYLVETAPLRAPHNEPYFADKIDAEAQVERLRQRTPQMTVTTLRTAPILGPSVVNFLTRYLGRRIVPTWLGHDPLLQFLHEVDAIAALKFAVSREMQGTFNIASPGVLRLSTVLKIAGRRPIPLPGPVLHATISSLWPLQLADAPPTFLNYLRYTCIADTTQSQSVGFRASYTSREALSDFVSAQRLRDVHLLAEKQP